MQKFRTIKKEVRIIAWDDGPFMSKSKGRDTLVGVIFRGGKYIDGLLKTDVEIDGIDATEKIVEKILATRHKDLRIVMLDGITLAGFNTVDIREIHDKTGLAVIAVSRKKPDLEKFLSALKKLPEYERRLKCVKSAGSISSICVKNKKVHFQSYGIRKEDAKRVIIQTSALGVMPEPLRVAHLIATGFVLGESVGHA
jgi:uncharacterized protein